MNTEEYLYRIAHDDIFTMQTFLRIVDEQKRKVPFRISRRPMQKDFVDRIVRQHVSKVIELKARRVGGTSLFMGIGLVRCHIRNNYNVLLLAQSDPDSRKFMKDNASGFKAYYDNMVPEVGLPDGSIFKFKLPLKTDSDHELTFEKTNSSITVATAGSKKAGRGGGYDMVIGTEVARWDVGRAPGTAEETWAMATGGAADKTDQFLIQESTAFGAAGFFYDTYQGAIKGENGFVPLFYDWRWHPAYAYEPGDMRALPQDRGDITLTEEETKLALTDAQARWRRAIIAELKPAMFRQEFPEDDQTCFLVSGNPFFDCDIIDVAISQSRPALTVNQAGRLRIWRAPMVGEKYLIGVDTRGQKAEAHAIERDLDYDAVVVCDSHLNHVATLHGRFDSRTLGEIVLSLSQYYNGAFVIPQAGPYGEAFAQVLCLILGYKNVYYEKDSKGQPKSVGLTFADHTKPMILESLKDAFEHGAFRTDDKVLLAEMRNFHRVPTASGHVKLEARSGHDDLVTAASLVTYAWVEGKFGQNSRFGTTVYYPDGRVVHPRTDDVAQISVDTRDFLAELTSKV